MEIRHKFDVVYDRDKGVGEAYEAYLITQWQTAGRAVTPYTTFTDQVTRGDACVNGRDVEIKFDRLMHETDRLYIETAERRRLTRTFVPSGIYARSAAYWYVIGDYSRVFIFRRQRLRDIAVEMPVITISAGTSQGWLLPCGDACEEASEVTAYVGRRWDGRDDTPVPSTSADLPFIHC